MTAFEPAISVLWITVGGRAVASSRVRAFEMAETLEPAGVGSELVIGTGIRGRVDVARKLVARSRDVVVIQKTLPDRLSLALVRRRARIVVFECDDALHLGYPTASRRTAARVVRALARTLDAVDLVTTSNPLLADELKPPAGRVAWFPGPAPKLDDSPVPRENVVLWLGSPSTEVHLKRVGDLPGELERRGWRSVAVGATQSVAAKGWHVLAWSEESARRQLARARVGIMPQTSSPWDDRKAAYKVLQYAAAGVIPVASDVLPARILLSDFGLDDLLVSEGGDWAAAVTHAAARADEYAPRLAALVSHYSHGSAAEIWIKAIKRALDDKDGATNCA